MLQMAANLLTDRHAEGYLGTPEGYLDSNVFLTEVVHHACSAPAPIKQIGGVEEQRVCGSLRPPGSEDEPETLHAGRVCQDDHPAGDPRSGAGPASTTRLEDPDCVEGLRGKASIAAVRRR